VNAGRAVVPTAALRALRHRLEQWNDRPLHRLNPDTRRRLLDTCAPDVVRLGELLGRDLTHWLA
jgi:hypothetical protein